MKEIHLWNFIYSHLKQNKQVILIAVVHHEKGSPGKQGFKMAISSDGEYAGSIGGGVMEYNILKKCKELLLKKITVNEIEILYHNKKSGVKRSGLICSGTQTNFTSTLTKKNIEVVKKICDSLKQNNTGKIIFSQNGISFAILKKNEPIFSFKFNTDNDWKFEQAAGENKIVFVIGGGHVGSAVCKILSMLDFYVVLYDSRDDLKIVKDNFYADKKIIDSYKNLGRTIKENSYIVIVTTGFDSDKEALKQVINKNAKYIGLMGTKAKINKIFSEAVKDGIKKELLKKIHAPIGIDINSDTPEEIAISIAAEIISIKNKIN